MRRTRRRRLSWFLTLEKDSRFYYIYHHHISAKFARAIFESDNDPLVRETALQAIAKDINAPWRVAYLSKLLNENDDNEVAIWASIALEMIEMD